jgi:hypothetical protein
MTARQAWQPRLCLREVHVCVLFYTPEGIPSPYVTGCFGLAEKKTLVGVTQICRFAFLPQGTERTGKGAACEHKESTTSIQTAVFLNKHLEVKQYKLGCSANMKLCVTVECISACVWLWPVSRTSLRLRHIMRMWRSFLRHYYESNRIYLPYRTSC